jgi:hypothetical protein
MTTARQLVTVQIDHINVAKVYNNLYLLTSIHNTNIAKAKWNNFSKQKVTGISTPVHYIKLQTIQNYGIILLLEHIKHTGNYEKILLTLEGKKHTPW